MWEIGAIVLEKIDVQAPSRAIEEKTRSMIDRAMAAAKVKKFDLDGRAVAYEDLSTCLKRVVDDMLARVGLLVGVGGKVSDAIDNGISAVRRETSPYSSGSRDQAAEIVRSMLGDRRARRMLQVAHDRMQHPASHERRRVRNRALRPVSTMG